MYRHVNAMAHWKICTVGIVCYAQNGTDVLSDNRTFISKLNFVLFSNQYKFKLFHAFEAQTIQRDMPLPMPYVHLPYTSFSELHIQHWKTFCLYFVERMIYTLVDEY